MTGRPPDSRNGRPIEDDRSAKNTTRDGSKTILERAAHARRDWLCTWCDRELQVGQYSCDQCRRALADQLHRRADADRRLIPLADLARWSA